MRICPRCGYQDFKYWRQNRWRTNVDFCPISEFEYNYPVSYKFLLQDGITTDEFYAYRLSGKYKQIVERIILSEYNSSGMQGFHVPMEHVNHKLKEDR